MSKPTRLWRPSAFLASALITGFGLTSMASAQTITISNTGPNSKNQVDTSLKNDCTITNTNDISLQNTNDQKADSGDALVSDNTRGGDATSGDVSNDNSTDLSIAISNGSGSSDPSNMDDQEDNVNPCLPPIIAKIFKPQKNAVKMVAQRPAVKAHHAVAGGGKGVGPARVVSTAAAPAEVQAAPEESHAVTKVQPVRRPVKQEFKASISNTGPNSTNTISATTNNKTTVTNTNKITISNTNQQHASSGDARVTGNTSGGSAATGDTSNSNSTQLDVSVSN